MTADFALSVLAELDREIEDTMGRIMGSDPKPGDYGLVSDLAARRIEITEPPAFLRLARILNVDRHGEPSSNAPEKAA